MSTKDYWFHKTGEEIASQLESHHASWVQYGTNPIAQAWLRNSVAYYSTILEPNDWQSALGYKGEQGELVKMVVPKAKQLVRQMLTLATKGRIAFRCIAENQKSNVISDTRLANALSTDLVKSQELDRKRDRALEGSLINGMHFYVVTWRTDRGRPYVADEQEMKDDDGEDYTQQVVEYDGDIEISTKSVHEVFWDTRIEHWEDHSWVEVMTKKNRWDLVAQYPNLKDEIIALPTVRDADTGATVSGSSAENEDLIYVFEVYHKPTPALPAGRMLMYSSPKTVYYDGQNHYGFIPVVPVIPEPIQGMGFGYPKLSDFLPAQEMFDHSLSAIATNQSALAVQSVLVPRGSNVSVNQIGSMNFIQFTPQNAEGGGKPEPLQLTQSAPETFKFADYLDKYMLALSGLNAAAQGQPPPGMTSGTAIATMTANAIEFLSNFSKADQLALERVMYYAMCCFATFAKVERPLTVSGPNDSTTTKNFSGDDLKTIKGVTFIANNPLMNTISGRMEVAEKWIQAGFAKSPQDLVSIWEGAPLHQLYETELSENDLIQEENEMLTEGEQVHALMTDDHGAHIRKHTTLLNKQRVRQNANKAKAIMEHILEHRNLAQTQDPFLTAMVRTGKTPPPPPPAPPGGMPMGGQPGAPAAPQGAPHPPAQAGGPMPGAAPSPGGGKGPSMPGDEPQQSVAKPANPAKDQLQRAN